MKTVTQADYSETYEKLQAAIAGNVAPDVALIEKDAARGLSDKKLVEDLSDRIKKMRILIMTIMFQLFLNRQRMIKVKYMVFRHMEQPKYFIITKSI